MAIGGSHVNLLSRKGSQIFNAFRRRDARIGTHASLGETCLLSSRKKHQIVFLHISKTAGTSISRYLNFAIPGSTLYHRTAEEFDRTEKSVLEKFDIVQGHISSSHLQKLRDDRFVFTFLRDPVDRVMSIYYFLRERSHPHDATNPSSPFVLAKQNDLMDFLRLKSPAVQVLVSNHQTYALGLDWRSRDRTHNAIVLRRAKVALNKMNFIGMTNRFNESVSLLFYELRLPDMAESFWENATQERRRPDHLSKEERRAIEDLNRLDMALYRYARRLYFIKLLRVVVMERLRGMVSMIGRWFSRRGPEEVMTRQESFETLMAKLWVGNPYDEARVSMLPYDAQEDWGRDNQFIRAIVQRVRPRTIIEVGTWKGCSAMAMCDALRAANVDHIIVCVDTWGGLEVWRGWLRDIKTDRGIPNIAQWEAAGSSTGISNPSWPGDVGHFKQFTSNIVKREMDQNIVPMPMDGRVAGAWFRRNKVIPDLVYLDASHDQVEVLELMNVYWDLLETGGVMIGADYHPMHPGVIGAVHEFSRAQDVTVSFRGNMWMACK